MSSEGDKKIVIYWSAKKTVGLICAILIVPVFLIFLTTLTFKQTLMNTDFYKSSLKKADAYNRLIDEGIPALIFQSKTDDSKFSQSLAKDLISIAISKTVDPAWVEGLTSKLIDEIAIFIGSSDKVGQNVSINLTNSQDFLTKASQSLLLLDQIIPTCAQIQANNQNNTGLLNSLNCSDPNTSPDQIKKYIADTQTKITQLNLGVVDINSQVSTANSVLSGFKNFMSNVNAYFWGSLIALIVLVLIIIALEFKNILLALKFIFLPIGISSALGMIIFGLLRIPALQNISLVNFGLVAPMESIIDDVLRANVAGVFNHFEIVAGIFLGTSLLIFVAAIIFDHNKILKKLL